MKIEINGIHLNYEKIGIGKPLIFIHGNGENHHTFNVLAESLKSEFTMYLIDSRNHGESSMTDSFHYMDMANDIVCFINALNLIDVSLFGFSDGGIVGLMMASFYPGSISKLVVAGANLFPSGLKKKEMDLMISEYEKTKNPYLKMMIDEPDLLDKDLNNIKIPTLVLAGEYDVVRRNHTMKIHRQIKHSKVQIFSLMNHDNYIANTTYLKSILIEFCK
jgi:pimeloyl-ACP methyl ester carboxylesterase